MDPNGLFQAKQTHNSDAWEMSHSSKASPHAINQSIYDENCQFREPIAEGTTEE